MVVFFLSLFWYALICVLTGFAIILKRTREEVALLLLSYRSLWLYMFCDSSLWCRRLICYVWLWYFLIILTFFLWSPVRKGLTSWLSCPMWCFLVFFFVTFTLRVVLDSINSWYMPSFLLHLHIALIINLLLIIWRRAWESYIAIQ